MKQKAKPGVVNHLFFPIVLIVLIVLICFFIIYFWPSITACLVNYALNY